jgi:hypothetical protein
MDKLGVGYLPYRTIRTQAEEFLREFNPSGTIPVPIEEIAEFKLHLEIIPTPNLQRSFDIEGFICSSLDCIYIDDYTLNYKPNRYRFTLAHEIGHIFLHRHIFQQLDIDSIESWKQFMAEIDEKEYGSMEFQGYCFGGLVLVPPTNLEEAIRERLRDLVPYIQLCRKKEISREDYLGYALDNLVTSIAPFFDVSTDVVDRRIRYDKLESLIP